MISEIDIRKEKIISRYSKFIEGKTRDLLKRLKWSSEDLDWLENQLEILRRNKCGGL